VQPKVKIVRIKVALRGIKLKLQEKHILMWGIKSHYKVTITGNVVSIVRKLQFEV